MGNSEEVSPASAIRIDSALIFAPPAMSSTKPMHVYGVLLTSAQVPSYIPGGARSFWKLIGLLLLVVGFLIALWLIWVVLRWVAKKLAAAFHRK